MNLVFHHVDAQLFFFLGCIFLIDFVSLLMSQSFEDLLDTVRCSAVGGLTQSHWVFCITLGVVRDSTFNNVMWKNCIILGRKAACQLFQVLHVNPSLL